MGLLEHINSVYYSQSQKQEGLLSLAEKFREKNTLQESNEPKIAPSIKVKNDNSYDITKPYESFIRMCQESNLNKAGLFVENQNGYFLNFSYNFTDKTVEKSKSSKSFWNGSLPSNDWQIFQKEELIGFYQLFNSEEIERIYKICFKRFIVNSKTFIFLTTLDSNQTIDTTNLENNIIKFINSIENFLVISNKLEKNCTQSQLQNNVNNGLSKSLKGQYMELNIVQLLKKIDFLNKFELLHIGSHIYNILKNSVIEPNICLDYPGKVKFVYFANSEIDAQMFEIQIKNNLCNYLNNDILDLISITNYTSTSDAKTLINLLLGK